MAEARANKDGHFNNARFSIALTTKLSTTAQFSLYTIE